MLLTMNWKSYGWKVAKRKEGHTLVEWTDTVPKTSVIIYDFELTNKNHLRNTTIQHLKEAYNKFDD